MNMSTFEVTANTDHARPAQVRKHPTIRALRSLVPAQEYPFGWVAAQRIAARQADALRKLARRSNQDPVDLVTELPTIEIRHDPDLPCLSIRHWHPIRMRWVITLDAALPDAARRFLILREFKHILDHPVCLRLYDGDDQRGSAQAELAADHFATSILMPARRVRHLIRHGHAELRSLAAALNVPEYRLILRLSDLDLIKHIIDNERSHS